ncbi:MAG: hypothetical protein AB2693_28855, partial [Candidatus Thiodiazotropha sp.]
ITKQKAKWKAVSVARPPKKQADMTLCNKEEPQQKYCLGTVSKNYLDLKHILLEPNLALCFCTGSEHLVSCQCLVHLKVSLPINES